MHLDIMVINWSKISTLLLKPARAIFITIAKTLNNLRAVCASHCMSYRDHIYICLQDIPNDGKAHNFVAAILEEQDSEVKH